MKRIGIERYRERGSAGLIEGETDSGQRWVMFVDEEGRPEVFWPSRDETSGAVTEGRQIMLGGPYDTVRKFLNVADDEEMVATFPVFTPDVWPRRDGDDPTDYTGLQRGVVFCVAQEGEVPTETVRRFIQELSEYYDAEERTNGV